jgi:hypothetical protein
VGGLAPTCTIELKIAKLEIPFSLFVPTKNGDLMPESVLKKLVL